MGRCGPTPAGSTGSDDAAHDVVQDVWLRVLRGLPGLRDPLRAGPWLFGIARRVLMDRLARRSSAPPAAAGIDPEACGDRGADGGSGDG